jgi:eukaryotic-like serine/threonine-protein kinase
MADNELEQRAKKRIGEVLCGKYRIDSVLGVGGMAVVFAATHRNQKRVAIKMLHSELSINSQLKTRFLREGYAANTVDHPGAVAVLDDDTAEDGAAFLVIERLEGEEVDRLWEKWGRHLPPDIVLAMTGQLLDVLAAAHAKSIIHRDIKPSNLYITNDGTVKVLDFGIARVRDAASSGPSATSTGMMLGTPAYMAPEQALGKSMEIDGPTDLWSVGATMFSLLSGQFVHEGESVTQLVIQVATQPARSIASVVPRLDGRIVEIVDRALAFHKAERWPSAIAMRDAVRDAYQAVYGSRLNKEPLERFLLEPPSIAATGTEPTALAMPAVPGRTPPPTPEPVGLAGYVAAQQARPVQMVAPPMQTPPHRATALVGGRPSTPGHGGLPPRLTPTQDMTMFPSNASASTAQPVSSEYLPPGLEKKRANVVLLALLAGVGIAVGAGAVIWFVGPHSSAGVAAPSSTPATAETTAISATAPPSVIVAPSPPPAAPPPSVSPPLKPSPPVAPVAPPTPHPANVTPHPTNTKVDCTIPYVTDSKGIRHPKPECE